MDNETRAAAERLRRGRYLVGHHAETRADCEALRFTDLEKVAAFCLAEHLPDDDTPVTTEWMMEQWETDREHRPAVSIGGVTFTWEGWAYSVVVQFGPESSGRLMAAPTRGDVRRLCRALGIELSEDGPSGTGADGAKE